MKKPLVCYAWLAASSIIATSPSTALAREVEKCVERAPSVGRSGPGYELLDTARSKVWVTRDWTPEDFGSFRLPFVHRLWRKNGPRARFADQTQVLRSPDCRDDGQYTYMRDFGREFLHVVNIESLDQSHARSHGFVAVHASKYQKLRYSAGFSVPTLIDSDGNRYIALSGPFEISDVPTPSLPEGWRHEWTMLTAPLELVSESSVVVVRADNGVSYQRIEGR